MRVAVIGAGASGILAFIKLQQAGYADVVVYEKASDLGGTWRDNRYPGLTCDVASHAYRYSFAPNAEWTTQFACRDEIFAYFKGVAAAYRVQEHIRFNQEVVSADYLDGKWRLATSEGESAIFDVVIVATGVLHHPVIPDIPGLDNFAGAAFHSARWPEDLELGGKRVGVVGTGSTAVQIVTAVAEKVAKLSLFQRTAQWILPLANDPIPEERRAEFRRDPSLLQAEYERINHEYGVKFARAVVGENPHTYSTIVNACKEHLDKVRDPELRRKLTPDYQVGCKRLVMSDGFYEAIQRDNAELVTESISQVEPDGVRTSDGRLHPLDVLVLATGFDTHKFFRPMRVAGENGLTIEEAWAERNEAYLAVAAPGFPNFFMIGGPNSPIGNFSWLQTAENQLGYIMQLIDLLGVGKAAAIAPTREATDSYNAALIDKMSGTIWATGCKNWYMDARGRVASWPWTYETFLSRMQKPDLSAFHLKQRVPADA